MLNWQKVHNTCSAIKRKTENYKYRLIWKLQSLVMILYFLKHKISNRQILAEVSVLRYPFRTLDTPDNIIRNWQPAGNLENEINPVNVESNL